MTLVALQMGGLPESLGQAAAIAGTLVLLLAVVGLAGFAYKQLRGGGIEWPEDKREDDDEVHRGSDDDEWDYY